MFERRIYRDVLVNKLLHLKFGWLIHKAATYLRLKLEGWRRTGIAPPPLACGLVVTENCNMRCPMCALPRRYRENPVEIDTETWKLVIDQLHELNISGIAISGGEPTMRSDAFELVAHATRGGQTVTLNSNMAGWTDEQIQRFVASGGNNVNVSIDSGRHDVNDQLRGGRNVLQRVLDRIAALARARKEAGARFSITVVTTLSDRNLDDLEVLFECVAGSGADRICFIPLHDIKDGVTYLVSCQKARPDLYEHLCGLSQKYKLPLENSRAYLEGFYNIMTGGVMPQRCNAGYTHLVIGKDLKIYRCIPYMNTDRYLFQWDPRRQRLKDLWNSPAWRQDRLEALNCKECFWDCHAEVTLMIPM